MKFKPVILESLLLVYLFTVYSCSEEKFGFRTKIPVTYNATVSSQRIPTFTEPSVHANYFLTKIPEAITYSEPEANLNKPILIKPFDFFVKEKTDKFFAKCDTPDKEKRSNKQLSKQIEPSINKNAKKRLGLDYILIFVFLFLSFGSGILSNIIPLFGSIGIISFIAATIAALLFIADLITYSKEKIKNKSNREEIDNSDISLKKNNTGCSPIIGVSIFSALIGIFFLYETLKNRNPDSLIYILISSLFLISSVFLLIIYGIRKQMSIVKTPEQIAKEKADYKKSQKSRNIGCLVVFLAFSLLVIVMSLLKKR